MSGQLGDDRSERIGGVGADDKVGEAALLPSPQDFLDGRRGSLGSTNSESAARSAAGSVSGAAMNGATASPTTDTWSASSTSRTARKSAAIRMISARESPGIAAKVTVSASSTASAQAFGPRTAISYRGMEVWAVEVSERRDGVTHLRQPLARCQHRQTQLAQFVFHPGSPGADAHLEATFGEHRQ